MSLAAEPRLGNFELGLGGVWTLGRALKLGESVKECRKFWRKNVLIYSAEAC